MRCKGVSIGHHRARTHTRSLAVVSGERLLGKATYLLGDKATPPKYDRHGVQMSTRLESVVLAGRRAAGSDMLAAHLVHTARLQTLHGRAARSIENLSIVV